MTRDPQVAGDQQRQALIELRVARVSDAPMIAYIGNKSAAEMAERIGLGHGQDHFVVVAVEIDNGPVVGFCSAGGARGQAAKGNGEIYECVVDPARRREQIATRLVGYVLKELHEARYAAVTCAIDAENIAGRAFAAQLGFHEITSDAAVEIWLHGL